MMAGSRGKPNEICGDIDGATLTLRQTPARRLLCSGTQSPETFTWDFQGVNLFFKIGNETFEFRDFTSVVALLVFAETKQVRHVLRSSGIKIKPVFFDDRPA